MKKFLGYIDSQLGRLFKRIQYVSWVDTQALAYFRIFLGIFILAHYLPEWQWLGDAPQAFFNPHLFTMASLFDGFWPKPFYVALDLSNLVLFCLLTLGIYSRYTLFALFLLNYTGYSFEFGFGKIDHEVHLFLITLLTLAFTNCGTKSALRKDKLLNINYQKWALTLLCIYIVFGFFTAGIPKFLKWVDFDPTRIGILEWFFKGYFTYDRVYLLADHIVRAPFLLLEVLDYLAPTMELLAIFFLLGGRRSWRIYLLLIGFFHMGNMLILNIEFVLNITCYGIFIIAPFLVYIRKYLPQGKNAARYLLIGVVGVLALYQVGRKIYFIGFEYPLGFFEARFSLENKLSVLMWVSTLIIGIISLSKRLYTLDKSRLGTFN